MSDHQVSAYPPMAALDARREVTLWSPGLRLMQQCGPRVKGLLLLLLSWLAVWLLLMLALNWPGSESSVGPFMHRVLLGLAGLALLALLYLAVCAWMSLGDLAHTTPPSAVAAAASPELGHPHEPDDEGRADEQVDRQPAQDLSEIRRALQLSSQQVNAAIGETARRTISLCGAFDSCTQHVEVADADLDAVQDEAAHTQQVMSSLREHLLTLGGHCQALGSAAHHMTDSGASAEAARRIDGLLEVLHAQIVHCHQLSERIGAAERSGQRRIDSIRRCIEALGHHAGRGLREGHQVMVLTRQIEASLAEGALRLEELGAACAVPAS